MRMPLMFLVAAAALVPAPLAAQTAAMTPAQAIAAATASPEGKVDGVFEMHVASAALVGFNFYLNSAADYHDPANLSIEVHAGAAQEIRTRLGGDPDRVLNGKTIRVKGTARRVRIDHRTDGKPDGKFYYQTRVSVDYGNQLEVVG